MYSALAAASPDGSLVPFQLRERLQPLQTMHHNIGARGCCCVLLLQIHLADACALAGPSTFSTPSNTTVEGRRLCEKPSQRPDHAAFLCAACTESRLRNTYPQGQPAADEPFLWPISGCENIVRCTNATDARNISAVELENFVPSARQPKPVAFVP